jgi:hypothetical protein
MHRIHAVFEDIVTAIGTNLLPYVEKVSKAFSGWLSAHKTDIADFVIRLLNTTAYILGWITGRVLDLLKMLGLFDPKKSKEVSVPPVPGQIPTGVGILDKLRAASQPQSLATPQGYLQARGRGGPNQAITLNVNQDVKIGALTGDTATDKAILDKFSSFTAAGVKKAVGELARDSSQNFAEGIGVTP